MCRLFAYTTKNPETTNELLIQALGEFRMLAKNGCVPCGIEPGHMDGWGIVAYKDGVPVLYIRSNTPAHTDDRFTETLAILEKTQPDRIIAHLRKTTRGGNTLLNTQPFLADNLAYCHNGTIKDLPNTDTTKSDSRMFFDDLVSTYSSLDSFKEVYTRYQSTYPYTAMNMLFSDGDKVIATLCWDEDNPNTEVQKLKEYYTLYTAKVSNCTFVCSEVLDSFASLSTIQLENKMMIEL